ncbi:hypothetical protein C5167_012704 [Papaver somniferum]|uniref:galactinol--sucrose galactosyltransferase n=1 Tax=Papaver somniferum TaxID=3469 RepID=A0A4Y7J2I7_PAPSO|nr:hypothetical protein C5167_012704 [Papaver somniferum]
MKNLLCQCYTSSLIYTINLNSLPRCIKFQTFNPLFSSSSHRRRRLSSSISMLQRFNSNPFQSTKRRIRSIFIQEGEDRKKKEMTITPAIKISNQKLIIKDQVILSGVPDNVIYTSAATSGPVDGIFVGADFTESNSRHVISLGTLSDVKFVACFRFKLWWMSQKMGNQGREIPLETQFLLTESNDGSSYTIFLPLIENSFRSCLQGNSMDELELCIESGDIHTKASSFTSSLFISNGSDPFDTIANAIRTVKLHLNYTFRQRHEKKLPQIVDYFGWCTWDAFYQDVTQQGVEDGLASLSSGGTPPKFVIIDDGWQSVGVDSQRRPDDQDPLYRLTGIKENKKFQDQEDPTIGIKRIVNIAKEKYGLKYVYVWHAITGYWGGVRPGVEGMEEYGSVMSFPSVSEGVLLNEPGWKKDVLAVQGLGLVNPKRVYKFYNELHEYLVSAGIDGVKVDVQCILETLGAGLGGRVELTRQYHQALDASVARNFADNGIIACMSHNTDALYCSKQTAVIRASDDFYPRDPVSHTIHIASVAYNSIFLGEFMQPDWDMFHSFHPAAEYHASARAISGGPVYVSDAPGKHNFEILKKIVLPDGSILRAKLPGRPTKDCLFVDPARDGISLLKIWNINKHTGVLGVYNCQGAAWSTEERKNVSHPTGTSALTGIICGEDVHLISDIIADPKWNGDVVIYRHSDGETVTLPHKAATPISLKVLEHEIFTVSPIKVFGSGFKFAPLGLIKMYNAGGAIEDLRYHVDNELGIVDMAVKGCGLFGVYSSIKPKRCTVESVDIDFGYDSSCGLVTMSLGRMPEEGKSVHLVRVELLV